MAMCSVAFPKVQNAIFPANGLIELQRFPPHVFKAFTCSYDDMPDRRPPVPNEPGFAHVAFAVDDVEKALETVISAGGGSVGEIAITEVDGVASLQVVYARDPEGNIVELQKWS